MIVIEDIITEMKSLLAEADERRLAWPPVFIESSMVPVGKFIVMSYSMFDDRRWRVLFHPDNRMAIRQVLKSLPKSEMRKPSKKDGMKLPPVQIHFEGSIKHV